MMHVPPLRRCRRYRPQYHLANNSKPDGIGALFGRCFLGRPVDAHSMLDLTARPLNIGPWFSVKGRPNG